MRSSIQLAAIASLAVFAGSAVAVAADHTDGSEVKKDSSTDINDVFAFTKDEKLVVAMSVGGVTAPMALSNAAVYTFHIDRHAAPLAPAAMGKSNTLRCKFASATSAECWAVNSTGKTVDYVKGDPSTAMTSASGKLKIHTGMHQDPFFFFLAGLNKAIETVQGVAAMLTAYPSGCPKLDAATVTALQTQLTKDTTKNPATAAVNNFEALNQQIIVAEFDPALTGTGDYVAVWGSTNKFGN